MQGTNAFTQCPKQPNGTLDYPGTDSSVAMHKKGYPHNLTHAPGPPMVGRARRDDDRPRRSMQAFKIGKKWLGIDTSPSESRTRTVDD